MRHNPKAVLIMDIYVEAARKLGAYKYGDGIHYYQGDDLNRRETRRILLLDIIEREGLGLEHTFSVRMESRLLAREESVNALAAAVCEWFVKKEG